MNPDVETFVLVPTSHVFAFAFVYEFTSARGMHENESWDFGDYF